MHGIEDSSIAWVVNSVDKSPAFLLANAGVDVWLGNNRGNMLSKKHVTKSPKNADFWDFSFEEMGLYDVPAFIDKILNETGSDMLDMYMGHSEGTTQFFIGSSMKSEYYASKVKLFSALAPIVRLDHNTNGGMNFAAAIIDPIAWLVPNLHLYNLIDFPEEILVSYAYFCTQFPATCV
jgi:lysosomal acid lipase/cholesteryl ester hydrolase